MNATKTGFKVVYIADWSWFELVTNIRELELEPCELEGAVIEAINSGDLEWDDWEADEPLNTADESFGVGRIAKISPRHDVLRVGDIIIGGGYGEEQIFIRRIEEEAR